MAQIERCFAHAALKRRNVLCRPQVQVMITDAAAHGDHHDGRLRHPNCGLLDGIGSKYRDLLTWFCCPLRFGRKREAAGQEMTAKIDWNVIAKTSTSFAKLVGMGSNRFDLAQSRKAD
jgi:hypothetical protein